MRIPAPDTPAPAQDQAQAEAEYLEWMDFGVREAREITEAISDCLDAGDQECLEEQAREYAVLLAALAGGPTPPPRLEEYAIAMAQVFLAYADAVEYYAKGDMNKGVQAALQTVQYNEEALEERKRVTQGDGQ